MTGFYLAHGAGARMLGRDDLVLCLGAIGSASFEERVRAASANGFAGISIWMSHYDEARAEGFRRGDAGHPRR